MADGADQLQCGLVAVDAAEVRRNANGAANVAAERQMAEAGRQRRRAAARGTARRSLQVPGIVGGPVDGVVTLQIGQHHRNIGLAYHDGARAQDAIHRDGVLLRTKVFVLRQAGGSRHAFHPVALFDGDGHAVEGAPPLLFCERPIGLAGTRQGRSRN